MKYTSSLSIAPARMSMESIPRSSAGYGDDIGVDSFLYGKF